MTTRTISSELGGRVGRAGHRTRALPVTRDLTLLYAGSLLIAVLVTAVAAAGLTLRSRVYPTEAVLLAFLPVDVFHLIVGVPALLGTMWLAWRGRLAGLLCWPGALLYVLYSYLTNLLGVPFGVLFLPYLLLVTLSAYTTIALVASFDIAAVQRRLGDRVPVRRAGSALIGLTLLFVIMNISAILAALGGQTPVEPEHPTFVLIADFITVIPLCLFGGIFLWRRAPLGYAAGAGLLLLYSLLLLGLIPVLVFPAVHDGSSVAIADAGLMLACGLSCAAVLARYVRGTTKDSPLSRISASRLVASFFGLLAGLGGMTHGIGEILQGNVRPEGIFINSWTQGPIATNMGGEPGITIVPNLLLTGTLTVLVALSLLAWALLFAQRKHGGRVLIVLSVILLLVGGGVGPPLIGVLAGVAISGTGLRLAQRGGLVATRVWRVLGRIWPWLFAIAAIAGTFLVIGSLILVFFFGLDNADLFLNAFYVTLLSLLPAAFAAPLFDDQRRHTDAPTHL